MPASNIDAGLGKYLRAFLIDARARGVTIPEARLNALRIFKFVDDINAEKARYGEAVSADENATVGTCANLDEVDSLNAGIFSWKLKETEWTEIWIKRTYALASEEEATLRELTYHELGHCLLSLEHKLSVPHHIMSPDVSSDTSWLNHHWTELVGDLFLVP